MTWGPQAIACGVNGEDYTLQGCHQTCSNWLSDINNECINGRIDIDDTSIIGSSISECCQYSGNIVEIQADGTIVCDTGYHLEDTSCVENQCVCTDGSGNSIGQGASGTDCGTHDTEICIESCNEGYNLQDTSCVENQCSCDNGTGATGVGCDADGTCLLYTSDAADE